MFLRLRQANATPTLTRYRENKRIVYDILFCESDYRVWAVWFFSCERDFVTLEKCKNISDVSSKGFELPARTAGCPPDHREHRPKGATRKCVAVALSNPWTSARLHDAPLYRDRVRFTFCVYVRKYGSDIEFLGGRKRMIRGLQKKGAASRHGRRLVRLCNGV